jgi:hypothetical protein
MSDGAFYAMDQRPRWRRLLSRLFPRDAFQGLDAPTPGMCVGEIYTHVEVDLGWRDLLRLLVSGRAHIEVRLETDALVNKTRSRAMFTALPPKWLERQ